METTHWQEHNSECDTCDQGGLKYTYQAALAIILLEALQCLYDSTFLPQLSCPCRHVQLCKPILSYPRRTRKENMPCPMSSLQGKGSSGRGITGGEAVQSRRRRVHARRRMADSNPPDLISYSPSVHSLVQAGPVNLLGEALASLLGSSGRGITGGEAVQSRWRRVHARRRMADSNPPDPH
eukprot:1160537-Pelagomonas_calceolata.AAC.2